MNLSRSVEIFLETVKGKLASGSWVGNSQVRGMGDRRGEGTFCREGGKGRESHRSFFSNCKWSRWGRRGLRCRWTGSRKQSVNSLWGGWKETVSITWLNSYPRKGICGVFFFFGYHFLNISLLLNETHWLKKSNQDKTVVDCPFRLKTEDFKDGEKIHWVKFF